ncbi:MAG: methylated-DNA--[protein]-cysteine S-methyltransferase [Chloroflexi bacterium]|nr:methylated-DNA--[protein]-cysteine S-methyltransferase [Chloroflexota bacterium]
MRCRDADLLLDAFLAGDLGPEAAGLVQRHIAGCGRCSSQAERGRRVLAAMRRLAPVETSPGFAGRVLEAARRLPAPASSPLSTALRYFMVETSLGEALVAHTEEGIVRFALEAGERQIVAELRDRFGVTPDHEEPPRRLVESVVACVEARAPVPRPRVSFARLPELQRLALLKTQEIHFGAVRPYWWVAREIGYPGEEGDVAGALEANPVPVLVPCHRIVMSDGGLGGYALGADVRAKLLAREGLTRADVVHATTTYYGCHSTGIFCFPTCPHARRVRPENVTPFHSPEAAIAGGFRPCLVCRPA